jgi:Na+-transporting NADH:ubiquinone oxidoreductase subunit D
VGLIITNCIIMGRIEAYALGNKPWPSLLDGLGNGLGYTWILLAVATVRELLGSGAISFPGMGQIKLLPQEWFIANGGVYENNNLIILPPMALILVGMIIWIQRSRNTSLIEEN